MMKQIFTYLFVSLNICLYSQDFHLSLYDAAPLQLNSAMTGLVDADWRVHAHFRTQWRSVNFKPYTTSLISFDMPKGKWGFGGQIINHRAGIGNYNAFQAAASAAYTVPLDGNKYHNLSMGVQAGITQKSVEIPLHTFDNQYVLTNGGGFDNDLDNGENFETRAFFMPVTNAGILYYNSKQQQRLNPFIGFSAFNLIEPRESFFAIDNSLPRRYFIHLGSRINITEQLYVIPKALYQMQSNFRELTLAADLGYYISSTELYALGGFVYRNEDAVIAYVGARKSNFILKIGYDFNVSTLSASSTGRGGFEVSFTYMKKTEEPKRKKICPRL